MNDLNKETIKLAVIEVYFYWKNVVGEELDAGFDKWREEVSTELEVKLNLSQPQDPQDPQAPRISPEAEKLSSHYLWFFKGLLIDPYRIFQIYKIAAAPQQHAIKKLLRAGKSHKTLRQDIQEVIVSLQRWLVMLDEDNIGDS